MGSLLDPSSVKSVSLSGASFRGDSTSDSEFDSIIFRVARCLVVLPLEYAQGQRLVEWVYAYFAELGLVVAC